MTEKVKELNSAKNPNPSSGKMVIERILEDPGLQDDIKKLQEEIRLHRLHESNELKKSEEQGNFVPEFKTKESANYDENYRPTILPGGLSEFVHEVGAYGSIYLRIPVNKVKNIESAITEANKEGLKAKVIDSGGHKYLQIYKEGYDTKDDLEVVEELKNVATKVSKKD